MSGVDLYTVKEILGHKTLVMTQRYAHLSPAHQRNVVERLARRRGARGKQLTPLLPEQQAGRRVGTM